MTHEEVEELVTRRVAKEDGGLEPTRTLEPLNENGDEQEGENGGNGNGQEIADLQLLFQTRKEPYLGISKVLFAMRWETGHVKRECPKFEKPEPMGTELGTRLETRLRSSVELDQMPVELGKFRRHHRNGYSTKRPKAKPKDKTEHRNWKRLCKIKAKVQKCQNVRVILEESASKTRSRKLKNTIECNLNPTPIPDGPGKPNSNFMEDCEDQLGPQSITTPIWCAIDKDCEDFEGPILALEQPISAIVHTKPTP
ncbi:hypothetical protein Tco_0634747 [Tanacetum coccineum]